MKVKFSIVLFLIFSLSCSPIQIENDLEAQSSQNFDFFEQEENKTHFNTLKASSTTPSINYGQNFIEKLSKTLFENSSCYCRNNGNCIRGCSKETGTCTGSKAIGKFTKSCTRHITGSIMHIMEQYCKKMGKTISKDQCEKDVEISKKTDGKYNICRQSLFYPSALCYLNMDGQNRINSSTISDKKIRKKCISEDSLTANLRYFYAKKNNQLQKLPIFIEFPFDNLEDLPFGSIIVFKSTNPNGHIEIKTTQLSSNNTPYFCSDYCVPRKKKGWSKNHTPLVAFRWNPLFINHLGQWDELDKSNPLNLIY